MSRSHVRYDICDCRRSLKLPLARRLSVPFKRVPESRRNGPPKRLRRKFGYGRSTGGLSSRDAAAHRPARPADVADAVTGPEASCPAHLLTRPCPAGDLPVCGCRGARGARVRRWWRSPRPCSPAYPPSLATTGPVERDHRSRLRRAVMLSDDPTARRYGVPVRRSRAGGAAARFRRAGNRTARRWCSTPAAPPARRKASCSPGPDRRGPGRARRRVAVDSRDTLVHGLPLLPVHGLVLGVLGPRGSGPAGAHRRPTPAGVRRRGGTLTSAYRRLVRICATPDAARQLRSARLLVSAAPPAVPVRRPVALTGRRRQRYGMTETLITVSARADGERRPGHVGVPVAGWRPHRRRHGAPLPPDATTIVTCRSRRHPFDGYLGDGRAVPDLRDGGWYATGDVARSARTMAPDRRGRPPI